MPQGAFAKKTGNLLKGVSTSCMKEAHTLGLHCSTWNEATGEWLLLKSGGRTELRENILTLTSSFQSPLLLFFFFFSSLDSKIQLLKGQQSLDPGDRISVVTQTKVFLNPKEHQVPCYHIKASLTTISCPVNHNSHCYWMATVDQAPCYKYIISFNFFNKT